MDSFHEYFQFTFYWIMITTKKTSRNTINLLSLSIILFLIMGSTHSKAQKVDPQKFTISPIGEVFKKGDQTYIIIDKKYEAGLMGMENFEEVTVIYWFDQNDTPEKRSILQVHPRGDKNNPMRGVFSTHSPVRPNLIAISRCKILSVKDNIIEIDGIDAFNHSPVLDLKN
jgi:tRNA-Thr(GGU) m(6)t(6)A37 methyltransferase TsaA